MNSKDDHQTVEDEVVVGIKKRCSSEPPVDESDHSTKKLKIDQGIEVMNDVVNEDDPAPRGALSINDTLFDDYNEESDQDWEEVSESDSDDLIEHIYPTLTADDEGLDDVDIDGYDEDSQYQLPWIPYTEEEAELLGEDAKEKGLKKFIDQYIFQESVPVAKLLDAFGISMHPKAAILATDVELMPILRSVITRFLRKRERLQNVNTLEDVAHLLQNAHNIMVVTGAGVSVSCGIPDFRSETGIYSRLQEYELDDPQQMFDIEYFRESPEIFYSFAKELYPANYEPSPSHLFVKLVEDKGKLLRNYTQNIDTLEHKAKIKRVVNCHGSFATATCVTCGYKVEGKDIEEYIMAQKVPPCPQCKHKDDSGVSIMKPDITFFGERLPAEFDNLLAIDTEQVDLLIVMGSSLKVSPVSEIMSQIPHSVPQILINRTPITHMTFDVQLLGNSDDIVPELCRMLQWDLKHPKLPGGSALSEESIRLSKEGNGDIINNEHKIWKFCRNGLYTFPGAVIDPKYINSERCDERGVYSDSEEDTKNTS